MAHDVFLSYSARNKPVADAVCAKLEDEGIRCWVAPRDIRPGAEWAEAIADAIQVSRTFVLIFSHDSNRSGDVFREISMAATKGIPVVAFRIDDVEPTGRMEYYLRPTHWLDAVDPPLLARIGELAETVHLILEQEPVASAPPVRSIAMIDSGKPDSRPWFTLKRLALGTAALVVVAAVVVGVLLGQRSGAGPTTTSEAVAGSSSVTTVASTTSSAAPTLTSVSATTTTVPPTTTSTAATHTIITARPLTEPERAAVSAGKLNHTVGLRADGTAVAVGYNNDGRCDVSSWSDVVAVSAGYAHTVGLRSDGTAVAVGSNDRGQCDVSSWSNLVAVAAGYKHTIGLRADGTVVAAGSNDYGECDVSSWLLAVPEFSRIGRQRGLVAWLRP